MTDGQSKLTVREWFAHPMTWVLILLVGVVGALCIWQFNQQQANQAAQAAKQEPVVKKKLYARMLKADCPIDQASLDKMYPVLQDDVIPHSAADHGFRLMYFFRDRSQTGPRGDIFSIALYDTEADMNNAGRDATSQYRFQTLTKIGCKPIDARFFDVISGKENRNSKEVVFPAAQ